MGVNNSLNNPVVRLMKQLLNSLCARLWTSNVRATSRQPKRRTRLGLETLEGRLVPAGLPASYETPLGSQALQANAVTTQHGPNALDITAIDRLDFSTGFANARARLTLNGAAKVSETALRLTDGQSGQRASVFTTAPVNVRQFATVFTFRLTNARAEGFTFTIQGVGATALGQAGAGLGYGAPAVGGTGGIGRSVAMKFDVFDNNGEGSNSIGLYLNGAAPTKLGSLSLAGSGIDLRSGHTFAVQAIYNGTTLQGSITDLETGATATRSFQVNVAELVGGDTAHVGFTASTGGQTATQDILSWSYTSATPVDVKVIPQGGKQVVQANGRTVGTYDGVKSLTFSADGQHYAFVGVTVDNVRKTASMTAVVDGVSRRTFNHNITHLQLSADGKRYAFVGVTIDNTRGTFTRTAVVDGVNRGSFNNNVTDLQLSADGKRFAFVGIQVGSDRVFRATVIVDGVNQGAFHTISHLSFSANSRSFAFVGNVRGVGGKNTATVVRDGRKLATLDAVSLLRFRADNRLLVEGAIGLSRVTRIL